MKKLLISAITLVATISQASFAQTPTPEQLAQLAIERRAVEAAIWGMPVVNYDLMLQEMLTKTAGKVNQVIYWGRPLDWHNQTLTPNPDTLYFMAFFNTKDVGPIVIEIPPGGRRRLAQRQHRQHLAAAAGGRGAAGRRQGRGRQAPDAAARLFGQSSRRLCRAAAGHIRQLRAVSLEPQEPRRGRRRQVGRLRQADQGLSALAGGRSAGRSCSPTSRTCFSIPPSATTRASSKRSTGSCRANRGSTAIGP